MVLGRILLLSLLLTAACEKNSDNAQRPPAPAPPKTTVQARRTPPPPPKTRSDCDIHAEITFTREWIRSCRLVGKLTTECKNIFDSDGNYTAPERAGSDRIQQWMNDSTACSCELPRNVGAQLNETLKSDKELCAIQFPGRRKSRPLDSGAVVLFLFQPRGSN